MTLRKLNHDFVTIRTITIIFIDKKLTSDIFDRPIIKHISYNILKCSEIRQCNCSLSSNKTGFTNV